ncbi:cathepsin O-like [Physella acuta]|uniref:cathepsin O-like n=1 Tax=Physella acuta TaxID=109671 RepID=UPI0027DB72F2|nr:cathepsin O-like [Physella acuta]
MILSFKMVVDTSYFRFYQPKQFSTLKTTMVLLLMLAISVSCLSIESYAFSEDVLYKQFINFAISHNKTYFLNPKNSSELIFRFETFKENVARAIQLNKAYMNDSYLVYGVNKFSDLTPEEFTKMYLSGLKQNKHQKAWQNTTSLSFHHNESHQKLNLPSKVDWRDKHVVNPVLDQETCGACWAFSTVETIESMFAIQNRSMPPHLSVQELIDCDFTNQGCSGGDITSACIWAYNNGVAYEEDYPLKDKTETCKQLEPSAKRVHLKSCSSYHYVNQETKILDLLANHGPVAVSVDATTWHNYIGGIIQFHCSQNINHAVQIVGYDLTGDVPYYIIRNSWGSNFGDKGYVYVKYGGNVCGLASEVSSLDVKTS